MPSNPYGCFKVTGLQSEWQHITQYIHNIPKHLKKRKQKLKVELETNSVSYIFFPSYILKFYHRMIMYKAHTETFCKPALFLRPHLKMAICLTWKKILTKNIDFLSTLCLESVNASHTHSQLFGCFSHSLWGSGIWENDIGDVKTIEGAKSISPLPLSKKEKGQLSSQISSMCVRVCMPACVQVCTCVCGRLHATNS